LFDLKNAGILRTLAKDIIANAAEPDDNMMLLTHVPQVMRVLLLLLLCGDR
jgi:hypothetical protein